MPGSQSPSVTLPGKSDLSSVSSLIFDFEHFIEVFFTFIVIIHTAPELLQSLQFRKLSLFSWLRMKSECGSWLVIIYVCLCVFVGRGNIFSSNYHLFVIYLKHTSQQSALDSPEVLEPQGLRVERDGEVKKKIFQPSIHPFIHSSHSSNSRWTDTLYNDFHIDSSIQYLCSIIFYPIQHSS